MANEFRDGSSMVRSDRFSLNRARLIHRNCIQNRSPPAPSSLKFLRS
jgi:hypothetical protein